MLNNTIIIIFITSEFCYENRIEWFLSLKRILIQIKNHLESMKFIYLQSMINLINKFFILYFFNKININV